MKNLLLSLVLFTYITSSLKAEVPYSLTRLSEVKDKESDAYIFLAHQAAMDARLQATSELEGENSSGALKILGLALNLMPHRNDLKDLRHKALETYVNITKKLEENVEKNCDILKERYSFLLSVAPDAIARVEFDKRCREEKKQEHAFKTTEPQRLKDLESDFKANVSHSTLTFPYEDVLNNTFVLLTSLYGENFKIRCLPVEIKDLTARMQCQSTPRDETSYKAFALKYCSFLEELLIVPDGKSPVKCTIGLNKVFPTSFNIYNTYVTAVDGPAFTDDIPSILSLNMSIKRKDSQREVPVLVRMDHKEFKTGNFPRATFEKATAPYFFETLGPVTTFELGKEDVKDLQEIDFTMNLKSTYESYKKHYETSIKEDLVCQKMFDTLKTMKVSRKKRNLEKSFHSRCPEKGNLEYKLIQ